MSAVVKWNIEQYSRLGESGIFDDQRIELLDGEIWSLGRQTPPHATSVAKTAQALKKIFAVTVICPKTPVTLSSNSEPEPDITVAVGKIDDYVDHHPGSSEILLLAEIADESLALDEGLKLRIYAEAGIAEYWIVNLVDRQLEVYREPSPDGIYAESRVYLPGESVKPLNAPGKSVAVADLLPPVKQEL